MFAALVATVLAALPTTTPAEPCRAPLPRGPAVPAPIVLTTSCGGFLLDPSGHVSRLPPRLLAAASGGTGRRYGADLNVRRTRAGRFLLLRHGKVVWRSARLYPNDGGTVAFGPGSFAFTTYREGVFLTDLRGAERLVAGRGSFPVDFTSRGELLVSGRGAVRLIAHDGATRRRIRYRPRHGFAFDALSDTLFLVTRRGVLAAWDGQRLRQVRPLGRIGGWMTLALDGPLVFQAPRSLTVLRRDGVVVARTAWPRSRMGISDSGVSVSPGGRLFAFRRTDARPGARSATAVVYVLPRGGTQARAVYRHRLGPVGCAVGATLIWHGRFLLYSSYDGRLAVVDGRGGAVRRLNRLARALPRRTRAERVSATWA